MHSCAYMPLSQSRWVLLSDVHGGKQKRLRSLAAVFEER
jgi:hypothetical protein